MVTKPPAPTPKKAQIQTAKGRPPRKENTRGKVVEKTEAAPKSAPSNPKRPDVSRTHEYLDSVKPGEIRSESKRLIEQLKQASEAGDHVRQTQLKDALAGLKDKANAAGMGPKDLPELADTSTLLQILQAVMPGFGGKKPPARAPAAPAREARGSGGAYNKGTKRKPSRRCELVPHKDLQCEEGQEAHHVVPDWMLRLAKRRDSERIPGMPSLDDGPAICMTKGKGKEHNTAHKHTDRPAARVGRSGKATGTPGTITLGQAKAVSARAIEKATQGRCSRADIRKQLDEQFKAHDDAILRAVKEAKKVTAEIRNVLNGGKD